MPFGKYKFLMVPFGLAQVPAYFQLLTNQVLEGLNFVMTYLDDIIIFSNSEEEHLAAPGGSLPSAEGGWTQDEMIQVQLLQEPDTLLGTSNF